MKTILSKIQNHKKTFEISVYSLAILLVLVLIWGWVSNVYYPNSSTNNVMINTLDTTKVQSNGHISDDYLNKWDLHKGNANVILHTNKGKIVISLHTTKAPLAVTNFLNLAKIGYYNETKFHRVIKDFMIQGGDFYSKNDNLKDMWGQGGPGYNFVDEVSSQDNMVQGDVAMANSGLNTNGSQFFIVTASSTPWLNGKHTIFGKVIEGMDVALKIQDVKVDPNDRPIEPVIIESVEIVELPATQ